MLQVAFKTCGGPLCQGKQKCIDEFSLRRDRKNGRQSRCKKCQSLRYKSQSQEINSKARERRAARTLEQIEADRIIEAKRYLERAEAKRAQARKRYASLAEVKANKAAYLRKRRANDLTLKLSYNLRRRVLLGIRQDSKSETTQKLLGCTFEFARQHIESQFQPGMTWANYGKWHVDHIRPCASFDLKDPEQQRQCFHYTNLQPLWASENLHWGDDIFKNGKWKPGICEPNRRP